MGNKYNLHNPLHVMRMRKMIEMCTKSHKCAKEFQEVLNVDKKMILLYLEHLIDTRKFIFEKRKIGAHTVRFYLVKDDSDYWLQGYQFTEDDEHNHVSNVKPKRVKQANENKPVVVVKPDVASAWMFNPL